VRLRVGPDRPAVAVAGLLALFAFLYFADLGRTHLANYDDCYYAQKAKEMVRGGDWLIPHFAGRPRFDNAPLFLWMMASAFTVAGITNAAAIFFSTLSGIAGGWAASTLAWRLGLGGFGAFAAAFVLLTTPVYAKYARHAMFDVFLTLLFVIGMLAYVRARSGNGQWFLLLGLVTGLGVLTKSVLGLFPFAVAVLHLAWAGPRPRLLDPWLWAGAVVAALVFLPWYAYAYSHYGDAFLHEHVRWLLVERAFAGPQRPWTDGFAYLTGIAKSYWPWLPLVLAGLWLAARAAFSKTAEGPERSRGRLLLLWLLVSIGTMSIAQEKKAWYVMSAYPALALLGAWAAQRIVRHERAQQRVMGWTLSLAAIAAFSVYAFRLPLGIDRRPDLQAMALISRVRAPQDRQVLNLDAGYWGTNNQFLFYSDRELTEPLEDPARVRAGLDAGQVALLRQDAFAKVAAGASVRYVAFAGAGEWLLVSATIPEDRAPSSPAAPRSGARAP
jgi:4-amino-4-deoxy-L-arabinose transferase-like glycosyltransferase